LQPLHSSSLHKVPSVLGPSLVVWGAQVLEKKAATDSASSWMAAELDTLAMMPLLSRLPTGMVQPAPRR
jgi:hypothetical protein